MKTFNFKLLAVTFLSVLLFSACGDDDGPGAYDKAYIAGNYTGTCRVICGSETKTVSFPAGFVTDGSNNSILRANLGNSETQNAIGLGNLGTTANNFLDRGNNTASFNMAAINTQTFSTGNFPYEIVNLSPYNEDAIQTMSFISLRPKQEAKYVLSANRQTIEFTYTGTLSITTKTGGAFSETIEFQVSLVKSN